MEENISDDADADGYQSLRDREREYGGNIMLARAVLATSDHNQYRNRTVYRRSLAGPMYVPITQPQKPDLIKKALEFGSSANEILEKVIKIDPELGEALSKAFNTVLKNARRNMSRNGATKMNEKRNNKADEYATEMFKVYKELEAERGSMTLREMAYYFQLGGHVTPKNSKEWYAGTIQALRKRWKGLGLFQSNNGKGDESIISSDKRSGLNAVKIDII